MQCQDWDPVVLRKADKSKPANAPKPKPDEEDGLIKKPKLFSDVDFGKRVQSLRAAEGLTRKQLAQKMMVRESVLENIEQGNGKEKYNGEIVKKLKQILKNL